VHYYFSVFKDEKKIKNLKLLTFGTTLLSHTSAEEMPKHTTRKAKAIIISILKKENM
jgi:hypothetical protein